MGELGILAGTLDYAAVGQAVSWFRQRSERRWRRKIGKMKSELSNVET
jgi:hypothetical protein